MPLDLVLMEAMVVVATFLVVNVVCLAVMHSLVANASSSPSPFHSGHNGPRMSSILGPGPSNAISSTISQRHLCKKKSVMINIFFLK